MKEKEVEINGKKYILKKSMFMESLNKPANEKYAVWLIKCGVKEPEITDEFLNELEEVEGFALLHEINAFNGRGMGFQDTTNLPENQSGTQSVGSPKSSDGLSEK